MSLDDARLAGRGCLDPFPLIDTRLSGITFPPCLYRIRAFRRAPHWPARAPGRILVPLYTLLVVWLRFRMDMFSPQSGIRFSSFPADALDPTPYRSAIATTVASCGHLSQKVLGTAIGFLTYGSCSHGPTKLAVCDTRSLQHSNCSAE